jgi:signal transduction histidine kinase
VLLAAVLLAVSLLQVLWWQPVRSPWLGNAAWYGPVLAVVSVVPLTWRRVHPVAAALVGCSLWWVPTDAFLFVGYFCVLLLFFAVGRHVRGLWQGLATCAAGLLSGTTGFVAVEQAEGRLVPLVFDADLQREVAALRIPAAETMLGIIGFWMLLLGAFAVGRYLAGQDREAERRIEAESEAARRQAVAQERERLVRELHDVVGHEVTLITIQSEAAARALDLAPERAAEPVAAVRETARRAGRELRAILDVLGEDELAVTPDPRGLEELADRAARLGIANRLIVTGAPWSDAPNHWLAVNRIVQECLTNAGKHSPGEEVVLSVSWTEDGVAVRAANRITAPAAGPGRGLAGMAERTRLLGGSFSTGHENGCFEVRAWLPAGGTS